MFIIKLFSSDRASRYLKYIFFLADIIILNVSYASSLLIKRSNSSEIQKHELLVTLLISILSWVFLVLYFNGYKLVRARPMEVILGKTVRMSLIHMGIVSLGILVLKFEHLSRLQLFYFFLLFSFLLFTFRIAALYFLKYIRSLGINSREVIIIGANENGIKIANILSSDLSFGYNVVGFFDDDQDQILFDDYCFIGGIDSVENYIKSNKVHEMYIALHFSESSKIRELIDLCDRKLIRIKFVPDFQDYTRARHVSIDFYDNTPVLMFRKEPLMLSSNRILKRLFDFIFSLIVALLILSWLFPVMAILIKIDSRGPVLYKQKRSGENNKVFTCLKFRSMKIDTVEFKQAVKDDPRVTRIGRFIRRTSIDELPQFLNVLLGDMSVVGPRPHPIKLDHSYKELINTYLVRYYAKPGITGWAQVNGKRGETKNISEMSERVGFDIWYIENWRFLLDLKIIGLTIINAIKGDSAAY